MSLRGTRARAATYIAAPRPRAFQKTLGQEVAALKRQVAANTKSPYYFRTTTTFLSSSSGPGNIKVDGYDITNNFVTSGTYHDNITGDKFINNNLHLTLSLHQNITQFRMIVYVPKNPDVVYTPASTSLGMVSHPDLNSFWVLKDVFLNMTGDDEKLQRSFWINLRKLQTIYNTDNNIIEKGRIRVCLIFNSTLAASSDAVYMGTRLSVTDK